MARLDVWSGSVGGSASASSSSCWPCSRWPSCAATTPRSLNHRRPRSDGAMPTSSWAAAAASPNPRLARARQALGANLAEARSDQRYHVGDETLGGVEVLIALACERLGRRGYCLPRLVVSSKAPDGCTHLIRGRGGDVVRARSEGLRDGIVVWRRRGDDHTTAAMASKTRSGKWPATLPVYVVLPRFMRLLSSSK